MGVWGVRPLTRPISGHGRGRGVCWSVLCERKPGGGVRMGIRCVCSPLCRARQCSREQWQGTLDLSWGGSPCPSALLGGEGPDSSGYSAPMRGPGLAGRSTGGVGGARESPAVPPGSPAGLDPNTPRGVPPVGSARGRGPGFVRVLCPHEGGDSAREAVLESLAVLYPVETLTRTFRGESPVVAPKCRPSPPHRRGTLNLSSRNPTRGVPVATPPLTGSRKQSREGGWSGVRSAI